MLSLVFDAVGVAGIVVYHFVLFCRPGTQNSSLFFMAKSNSNLTKNCLCTSNGFGCRKIDGSQQHSNSNSVTPPEMTGKMSVACTACLSQSHVLLAFHTVTCTVCLSHSHMYCLPFTQSHVLLAFHTAKLSVINRISWL